MALIPRYTDRGPTSSKVENERVRDHLDELYDLYQKMNDLSVVIDEASFIGSVESVSLNTRINELEALIEDYDGSTASKIILGINNDNIVKTNGVPTDPIGSVLLNPLHQDDLAMIMTLPQSEAVHKLYYTFEGLNYINPEVNTNYITSLTSPTVSNTENAYDGNMSTAFYALKEDVASGTLDFYITVPENSGINKDVNRITIYPFPSAHQTLNKIKYSTEANRPIDETGTWQEISTDYSASDDYLLNQFRPPTEFESADVNQKENLPITRYYIRKNLPNNASYTSFKISLESDAINYNSKDTVVLGIRGIDLSSVQYSNSGEIWMKYTTTGTTTIDDVISRITNQSVVNTYEPTVTIYTVNGGQLSGPHPLGTTFNNATDIYFKVEVEDPGANDTPIFAGLVLNIS